MNKEVYKILSSNEYTLNTSDLVADMVNLSEDKADLERLASLLGYGNCEKLKAQIEALAAIYLEALN